MKPPINNPSVSEEQKTIIRELKGLGKIDRLFSIPIVDEKRVQLGFLQPVTAAMVLDPMVISLLTKWRNMFMKYFLTQFTATEDRTRRWLENVVLADDEKILFLIKANDGSPLGNFAVRDIANGNAELDNLIRGEQGGGPHLIYFSELALMNWLFTRLKIEKLFLRMLASNLRVRALHKSVGFKETGVSHLKKVVESGEIRYDVVDLVEKDHNAVELQHMEIQKEQFYRQHHWLKKE